MLAAMVGIGRPAPCSLSGNLDATASAGVATSASRTVSVPLGNSGQISFGGFVDIGTITNSQTSQAGGSFTNAPDPTTLTFTDGQTIQYRTNGNGAGESRSFVVTDVTTGVIIGIYNHTGG